MRKLFLFISIVTFASNSHAQKGAMEVSLFPSNDKKMIEIFEFRLYANKDSSLTYKSNSQFIDNEIHIDSVAAGLYNLNVYKEGKQLMSFLNIKIVSDSLTKLVLHEEDIDFKIKRIDFKTKKEFKNNFFGFSFQSFQTFMNTSEQNIHSSYAFGFKSSHLHHFNKIISMGANISSHFNTINLQKGKVNIFTDSFEKERYINWKFSLAYVTRFTFRQPEKTGSELPWFLEIGAGYNLPIMYRYVGVVNDKKQINRFISNFNDFSAIARLGMGAFCITAEYRLTNNLKPAFALEPAFKMGIDLLIPFE